MGRGPAGYGLAQEAARSAEAGRIDRYIETHLFEPLSSEIIAEACGGSAAHLARRFRARKGESLMAFVRGRRLEVAAASLAKDNVDLAQLALASGFGSQSAFTRAFSRAFGVSPGEARGAPTPLARKRKTPMLPAPTLIEREEYCDAINLAGLSARFEPKTYVEVAELWKRAVQQFGFPGQSGTETIGAFRDRDLTAGVFEHLAGVRVTDQATLPEGFEVWSLPAGKWLVLRQALTAEPLHLQMMAAETEIRANRLPQSGRRIVNSPDFQLYPAPFKLDGGWLEHWLPVEA